MTNFLRGLWWAVSTRPSTPEKNELERAMLRRRLLAMHVAQATNSVLR